MAKDKKNPADFCEIFHRSCKEEACTSFECRKLISFVDTETGEMMNVYDLRERKESLETVERQVSITKRCSFLDRVLGEETVVDRNLPKVV